MQAIFALVQCWSKAMVVLGTLWNTSANVYLRLKGIIQPLTVSLWPLDWPWSVGGIIWLVNIFLC